MKKTVVIVLLVIVGLFLQVAPLMAWGEIKKAKENLDMGFYENAYKILNPFIEENPTNLDANLQLGRYYFLTGNIQAAMKRFDIILQKDQRYKNDIGNYFAKAADHEANIPRFNCNRIYNLLTHAYAYDPHLAIGAEDKLIDYGDKAREQKQYACAEKFYRLADRYSKKNIKKTTAHRYLYLAALGHKTDALKTEVEPVLGKDFVGQVLPGKEIISVFNKTFTISDAYDKKYGQINVFKAKDFGIKSGDRIEIQAQLLSGDEYQGEEIGLWRGKQFKPKWATTTKGYYSQIIEEIDGDKYVIISLNERKDLKVTVIVTREVTKKANFTLLAQI